MQNQFARYPKAYLSPFTTTELHIQNPYVVAAWSLLTPGLGSLLQQERLKGLVLLLWSIIVNWQAHLNLALWYSLTGHFDLAHSTVDTRWLLLYVSVYVYGVWASYRGTVDTNMLTILSDREGPPIQPMVMKAMDLNYLDKRHPWIAMAWSALTPGLGGLYLHKIIPGIFFVAWTIVIAYLSHGLQAIHLTMVGEYQLAKGIVDMEWLLFFPPVYGYQIYDSYVTGVEHNKLFEREQSQWLRKNYQQRQFEMPI